MKRMLLGTLVRCHCLSAIVRGRCGACLYCVLHHSFIELFIINIIFIHCVLDHPT